jgi:hypothetical protein
MCSGELQSVSIMYVRRAGVTIVMTRRRVRMSFRPHGCGQCAPFLDKLHCRFDPPLIGRGGTAVHCSPPGLKK